MLPILFAAATVLSTFSGGLFALKHSDRLHRILGFTAGVILGVVAFDILPETFAAIHNKNLSAEWAMLPLVAGFLMFHIIEKSILLHNTQERDYGKHHHPHVGVVSASALIAHSFLDGVGIGLGFQVSHTVGLAVAIAVIAHDFSDGLNTVSLMILHKNETALTRKFLIADAIAPVIGAASTLLLTISPTALIVYLGFFAGFLLYIGSSEILPEAHSQHSSYTTISLTVLGAVFMFIVTRFI